MYVFDYLIGIVLDFGDGVFSIIFIYEGYSFFYVIMRLNFVGCDLIDYLIEIFLECGYLFIIKVQREIVRGIKEKFCYVSLDFDEEMVIVVLFLFLEKKVMKFLMVR